MAEAILVDIINIENEFNQIVNESLKINKAITYLEKADNIVSANENITLTDTELKIINKYLTITCEELNIKHETIRYPMTIIAQEGIGDAIKDIFDKIFEFIGKIFEKIGELLGKIADWFKSLFKSKTKSNKDKCDSINSTIKEIKDFPKLKDPLAIPNDEAKKLLDKLIKVAILLDKNVKVENMFYLENNILYVYITKSLDTAEEFVNKILLNLTDVIKKLKDDLKNNVTPVDVLTSIAKGEDKFVDGSLAFTNFFLNSLKDPFHVVKINNKFIRFIEDSIFNKEVLTEIPKNSFATKIGLNFKEEKATVESYSLEGNKTKQIKNTEKNIGVNIEANSVMIDKDTDIKEVNKTSFDNIYNKFTDTISDLGNECTKIGNDINGIKVESVDEKYKKVFGEVKNILVVYTNSIKSIITIITTYGNFANELYSVLLDINNAAVIEIKKLKEKEEKEKKKVAEEAINNFVKNYIKRS